MKWTDEELEYLRNEYPNGNTKEIANKLNRSAIAINSYASLRGIKKTDEFIVEQKKKLAHGNHAGRFKKGSIPYNKGMKMSEEFRNKLKAQWFKEGRVPHNKLPIGSETKRGDGYIYVKIANPNVWDLKQRVIYENSVKKLKDNEVIEFKDGNTENFDISNLVVMTKTEHLAKYSIHNYPSPIKDIIYLMKRINCKIKRLKK